VTLLVLLLAACGDPAKGKTTSPLREEGSMLRGSRRPSKSHKASDNRPHPWQDEHGVFESDRFRIEPYIERRRAAHREEHAKQVLVMETFSHPACHGLKAAQRRACPLLDVRWSSTREVSGGLALVVPQSAVQGRLLHRRVVCHIAFGKVHATTCPLHLPKVRAATAVRGENVVLTIVTDDPSQVKPLRDGLRELIP
jgi:hypothetical protein